MIGDNLSQNHNQYQKASRNQGFYGDNLNYQKKTLEKIKMNNQFDKSFICHIRNVPKYTIIYVNKLTNIIATEKILFA